MNDTRFLKLVVVPALILAAIVALQAFRPVSVVEESSRSYAGMGDLHVVEAQYSIPDTGKPASSLPYVGMGDLHIIEAGQLIPDTGAPVSRHPYAGMGDLHRLEAGLAGGRSYVGMGDLHRFEAQQEFQNTGGIGYTTP